MPWYKEYPERYKCEVMLIKRNHPAARLFIKNNQLVVFLKVTGRKNDYVIQVTYPDYFPQEPPKAWIVKPRITNALHKYSDDSLCCHPTSNGPHISGKVIIDCVKKWIHLYEYWLDTGYWPDRA